MNKCEKASLTRRKGVEVLAQTIYEETKQHYETGNQRRLYQGVWRRFIYPKYGIGYRSFLKYIKLAKRLNGEDSVLLYSKTTDD